MARVIVHAGLDIETTGSECPRYEVCQVGVVLPNGMAYVADVGHDAWEQTEEAIQVNGFTASRILAAPRYPQADERAWQWMSAHGIGPRHVVPVGWNVGSFDVPFLRAKMPKLASLLSCQSVDLNAVCFTMGHRFPGGWRALKDAAKAHAVEAIGRDGSHDAGWDALAALRSWEFLKSCVRPWLTDG